MPKWMGPMLLAFALLATTTCGNVSVGVCGGWWCVSWTPPPPPCLSCAYPTAVSAADFDGDGHLDVAFGADRAHGVGFLFGDGQGGIRETALAQEDVGASSGILVAGRFDGDGYVDLAVLDPERGEVRVLRSDGSGEYGNAGGPVAAGALGRIVAARSARMDGDEFDDLVLLDEAGVILVLLSDSAARLAARDPVAAPDVGMDVADLILGDVDADGHEDALVLDRSTDSVAVLLGDGQGGLVPVGAHLETGGLPAALAGGEFDGMPGMDVALIDAKDGLVRTYFSNADGTFTPSPEGPLSLPAPYGIGLVAICESAAGDGTCDLAATYADETTAIFLVGIPNLGGGVFGVPGSPVAIGTPERVTLGDWNGDGRIDVIVANPSRREVGFAIGGTRAR